MKKIVWVCGLIAGLIVSSWSIYSMINPPEDMNWDMGMVYGYGTMLLAFALIFVGIKNYRDKHLGGTITFGKAFLVGLYITLIASTIYVVMWIINFRNFNPDFMDKYAAHMIEQQRAAGVPEAQIQKEALEMKDFGEMYKSNVLVTALFTYLEILPVGLLVSLIAALILKRRRRADPEQAPAGA
jgi:hypothetical protein